MPELPEVETIIRTLEKSLLGDTILSVDLRYEPLLETTSPFTLDHLVGASFTEFKRKGKYLIFGFDNGLYWVVHLRMEGKYYLYNDLTPPTKHTHLLMTTNYRYIHYLDTRKFSRMAVVSDLDGYLASKNLGLEPFDEGFDGKYLASRAKRSTRAIKNILLDQSIISGLGNIYADEVLFDTAIHPLTKGTKLTYKHYEAIAQSSDKILTKAIAEGGTTIRSYTSSLGVTGLFQVSLKAYGQAGKPCSRCSTTLKRIIISGRSSVFCPECQKEKV